MSKQKISTLSFAIIITGYLIYYFEGYKDAVVLKLVSFILIFVGWVILFNTFFGDFAFNYKGLKNKYTKMMVNTSSRFLLKISFLGFVLGQIFLIVNLTEKRVAFILQNGNTQITIATITNIQNRHNKYGNHFYARIRYQSKNRTVNQAIEEISEQYKVGQVIRIKYSLEYPEMFKVE